METIRYQTTDLPEIQIFSHPIEEDGLTDTERKTNKVIGTIMQGCGLACGVVGAGAALVGSVISFASGSWQGGLCFLAGGVTFFITGACSCSVGYKTKNLKKIPQP